LKRFSRPKSIISIDTQRKAEKKRVSIRLPAYLIEKVKEKAKKEYPVKNYLSRYVSDALTLYFQNRINMIEWTNSPSEAYILLIEELETDSTEKDLSNPLNISLKTLVLRELEAIEAKIRKREDTRYNVKPAIIRRAIREYLLVDRTLFETLQSSAKARHD
jgi:hypothetical protein